ncbi:MAG TPA: F0F1 ATP synthase subunit B [Pseudonocardiaceae bacterium]|jgi:ATP synthase F0 subunit b|nr:F0F1 ATP synthase subunit B [Pseudonocardiaceae bacterium]
MAIAKYIAELIAFAIIVFVVVRYVVPPIRKMMTTRQDAIRKQIEESKATSARLAEAERTYKEALTEARTEAAKIRDGARADAQRIVVEMREQAEREVARIKQRGEEDLVSQRQQVIRELRTRIGQLSVDLAGRLVAENLSTDAQRAETVDRLLDELASMSARDEAAVAGGNSGSGNKGDA